MVWLLLVLMTLNRWLVTPVLNLAGGLLEFRGLPWVLVALGLWLFAGAAAPRLESGSLKPRSGAGPGRPRA